MKPRSTPTISARKRPRQARSARLVEDILEAAVRVLAREGARRFTTVRVAEEAGVSVGSLYQYFPNKESILFRLQADEWKETGDVLADILGDPERPPAERLRRAIRAFFRSERDEAALRGALADAGAPPQKVPETSEHHAAFTRRMLAFMEEALPDASPEVRAFAAEVVKTSISAIGERISEAPRSRAEIDAWADVVADMQCGYLERLRAGGDGVR